MLVLAGKVPVKIAPDSEPIAIGDFLTASSTYPGMAQKATKAGYTVAKALENWDPANPKDTVLVFVNLSWWDGGELATISATLANLPEDISSKLALIPQIQSDIALLQEQMASVSGRLAKVSSEQETMNSQIATMSGLLDQFSNVDISTISANFANFSDSLKVIGTTQLGETTIGGALQVGFLHFDDLKAEISSLTGNVTINSNLNVMGDATVSGQLKVEKGIVLPDTATGEDYCVQVTNGEVVKKKGNCN